MFYTVSREDGHWERNAPFGRVSIWSLTWIFYGFSISTNSGEVYTFHLVVLKLEHKQFLTFDWKELLVHPLAAQDVTALTWTPFGLLVFANKG